MVKLLVDLGVNVNRFRLNYKDKPFYSRTLDHAMRCTSAAVLDVLASAGADLTPFN